MEELKELIIKLNGVEIVDQRLEEIEAVLTKEREKLDVTSEILRLNVKRREKVNKNASGSFYKKFINSLESKIDEIEEEYIELSLQYRDLLQSIELLQYEQQILKDRKSKKDQLEFRLNQIMDSIQTDKVSELGQLKESFTEVKKLHKIQKELKEAISYGNKLLRLVRSGLDHLGKIIYSRNKMKGNRRFSLLKQLEQDESLKFMERMVALNHNLFLFQKELGEYYQELAHRVQNLGAKNMDFLTNYRKMFLKDMSNNEHWDRTHKMIKKLKALLDSLMKELRKEVKSNKTKIDKAEDKYNELLSLFASS